MKVKELCNDFEGDRVIKMTVVGTKADMDVRARTGFRALQGDPSLGQRQQHQHYFHFSDNGSDARVMVGTGWTILIKTAKKANLVGFDSNCARKKGLLIVMADAAVRLQDELEVVI